MCRARKQPAEIREALILNFQGMRGAANVEYRKFEQMQFGW
jgi:hypothetical protein